MIVFKCEGEVDRVQVDIGSGKHYRFLSHTHTTNTETTLTIDNGKHVRVMHQKQLLFFNEDRLTTP